MRPEEKFNELKNLILDEFRKVSHCNINIIDNHKIFRVLCMFSNGYSFINCNKDDLTTIDVGIYIGRLFYHNYVDLQSEEKAEMHLSKARIIETFDDYLSVFEQLLDYQSQYEYTSELLYMFMGVMLVRKIESNGNVVLRYSYHKGKDKMMHEINISKTFKSLLFEVYKNENKIARAMIIFGEAHKVFKSVIEGAVKFYALYHYLRYEEAIIKLIRLVNTKKLSIEDAVKELIEKHGYGDVFG